MNEIEQICATMAERGYCWPIFDRLITWKWRARFAGGPNHIELEGRGDTLIEAVTLAAESWPGWLRAVEKKPEPVITFERMDENGNRTGDTRSYRASELTVIAETPGWQHELGTWVCAFPEGISIA